MEDSLDLLLLKSDNKDVEFASDSDVFKTLPNI